MTGTIKRIGHALRFGIPVRSALTTRVYKAAATFCFLSAPLSVHAEDAAVKFGLVFPLSGSFATIGEDCRQGVEAAKLNSPNSKTVEFITADSKGDPKEGIAEFRKLVESDKVSAVFAFRGPIGMALNPISLQAGVPLLGGVGHKDFATNNRFAFQIWPTSDREGDFIAEQMIARGFNSAAILSLQDDWTSAVSDSFRLAFIKRGGSIVFDQEVVPSTADFRTELSKIRSANPQGIFLNLGLNQFGPALKQVRDLKLTTPLVGNFWVQKKEVINAAGIETVEGVMFDEMSFDLPKLKQTLKEKFQVDSPSGATLSSYIGAALMLQAAAKAPAPAGPAEVYQTLLGLEAGHLPDGDFEITDRRVQFPLQFKVLRNGKAAVE